MLKRSFQSTVRSSLLVLAGCLLVASTYGLARFGVGLLHPAMAEQHPGLAGGLPAAGAAAFASYCLAAGLAMPAAARRPRTVAAVAGGSAAAGCLGLAASTTTAWFVASAFVAGAGAGFASPALVVLLDRIVTSRRAGSAQAVVNAGTSVGVALGGVSALSGSDPGVAWPAAATLCLASATGVVALARSRRQPVRPPVTAPLLPRALLAPTAMALAAGAGSAAVWTYGPTVALASSSVTPDRVGLLWVALGTGGLLGALVSAPVSRWGPGPTFVGCSALLGGTALAVLVPGGGTAVVLAGAAGFGAAYMAMSGTLILWGRRIDSSRAGSLTAWLFVALAVGQAGGSLAWGTVLG